MANILVTTLPAYPFAFFRIIHHKTITPVMTLPYRPIYNDTDRTALLAYLEGTYKSANGFLGNFSLSGSSIIYTTDASESYGPGLFEVMLLTKVYRLHVNNPASFGYAGQLYFWNWGIVVSWGDGTYNGYREGDENVQSSVTPQHNYTSGSQAIDVFHNDSITVFLCRDPALLGISGTVSSALHTIAVTHSQIQLLDMDILLRPAIHQLDLIEFRNTGQLRLFGVSRPWVRLEAFNFSQCNFSRVEVDRMFQELYLVGLACPEVRGRSVHIYAAQTPAAPPTDATLAIRRIMLEQWGWVFFM